MYRMVVVTSLVFAAFAYFMPAAVMSIFTTDTAVIAEGAVFMRIVGLSYPLMSCSIATLTMLRSIRAVKISVVVSLSAFLTNLLLNWMFIFGNLGAPRLGVAGAAIATCISRVIEFTVAMTYVFVVEKRLQFRPRMLFQKIGGQILRNFAENSVPVAINELAWGTGAATIAVIIGRMGREFTAAYAITGVLSQFVTIILFAMSNAAAVITGNTVGKGDYQKAREYSVTFTILSAALGLASGGVVLLSRDFMLSLYNISDLARQYGWQIISLLALITFFQSIACTILIGVLRGGGDSRFVLLVDIVFLWLVCIPAGFFVGLYLHWPVFAVYLVIKSDEIIKVAVCVPRMLKGNWVRDLTLR
jgi:putative MATE family efflux protein